MIKILKIFTDFRGLAIFLEDSIISSGYGIIGRTRQHGNKQAKIHMCYINLIKNKYFLKN